MNGKAVDGRATSQCCTAWRPTRTECEPADVGPLSVLSMDGGGGVSSVRYFIRRLCFHSDFIGRHRRGPLLSLPARAPSPRRAGRRAGSLSRQLETRRVAGSLSRRLGTRTVSGSLSRQLEVGRAAGSLSRRLIARRVAAGALRAPARHGYVVRAAQSVPGG